MWQGFLLRHPFGIMTSELRLTPLRVIVHVGGCLPLAVLVYDFFADNLTVNPIQTIEQRTGLYALTFLLITLVCTPGASLFGWKELIQRRRALGNYSFLYAALHVATFFGIDYGLDFIAVWRDVWNKPYVIVGVITFLMLLSLSITSFTYWMKRLGKNWKRLHKLIYIIAPLAILHFVLVVKGDITRLTGDISQPILYGSIAAILLIVRIPLFKSTLLRLRYRFDAMVRSKGSVVLGPMMPEEKPEG